jgi:hypothetical protein
MVLGFIVVVCVGVVWHHMALLGLQNQASKGCAQYANDGLWVPSGQYSTFSTWTNLS